MDLDALLDDAVGTHSLPLTFQCQINLIVQLDIPNLTSY